MKTVKTLKGKHINTSPINFKEVLKTSHSTTKSLKTPTSFVRVRDYASTPHHIPEAVLINSQTDGNHNNPENPEIVPKHSPKNNYHSLSKIKKTFTLQDNEFSKIELSGVFLTEEESNNEEIITSFQNDNRFHTFIEKENYYSPLNKASPDQQLHSFIDRKDSCTSLVRPFQKTKLGALQKESQKANEKQMIKASQGLRNIQGLITQRKKLGGKNRGLLNMMKRIGSETDVGSSPSSKKKNEEIKEPSKENEIWATSNKRPIAKTYDIYEKNVIKNFMEKNKQTKVSFFLKFFPNDKQPALKQMNYDTGT